MRNLYVQDLWWMFLILALCSYLVGNINFAIIISRSKNKDITKLGSGNPGTMNMSRNFGLGIGVLTLLLDIVKGVVPTLVGYLIFKNYSFGSTGLSVGMIAKYVGGFFAVLGHVFPFWLKFKGGKGIATTIGVFLVAEPLVTVIALVVALTFILITEMGSMGSFIATTPSAIAGVVNLYNASFYAGVAFKPALAFFLIGDILVCSLIILTWYAHRVNIVRLLSGEEHATNWLQMIKDLKYKSKLKKKNPPQKEEDDKE